MLVARGRRNHIIMSVPQGMEFVNNPCQIKYVDIIQGTDATLFGGLLNGPILLAPILDVMRITGVLAVFPAAAAPRPMTVELPGTAIPSRAVRRLTAVGVIGVRVLCHAAEEHRLKLVLILHQMSAAQLAAVIAARTVIPSLVPRHIRL